MDSEPSTSMKADKNITAKVDWLDKKLKTCAWIFI